MAFLPSKQHVQDRVIPRQKTKEALLELKVIVGAHPKMVAYCPVEVYFIQGNGILLSSCFQRHSCYMNIIMYELYARMCHGWTTDWLRRPS